MKKEMKNEIRKEDKNKLTYCYTESEKKTRTS